MLTPSVSEIEGAFLVSQPRQRQDEISRLEKRLARERKARVEAEAIAERGMRELYEKQRQILWLAITDELTGLFNRRHLFETMQRNASGPSATGGTYLASCWMWTASSDTTTSTVTKWAMPRFAMSHLSLQL